MLKAKLLPLLLASLATLGMLSCGPGAEPPANPDTVATVATNQAFPFSTAATYYLAPDVVEITGATATPTPAPGATPGAPTPTPTATATPVALAPTALDPSVETAILAQIETEMNERGYTRLMDASAGKPDIFIQASVMSTTDTDVYYSYWYPYWGTYYDPFYYGFDYTWSMSAVPVVESTTTGALVVEFTNPNSADPTTKKIPSIWVGVVTGITDGASAPQIRDRATKGINQAFTQSPYIGRK
jgi:hypothetical protein